MKKLLLMTFAAALIISCGEGKKENLVDGDSVNRILNQKDAEINNLLGTVNDIQDGLRQITEAQGRINELKGMGNEASAANDIREQMAFIQRTMELNQERITQLEKELKNSNINAQSLKATITSLQSQLNDKSMQIQRLTAELADRDLTIKQQAEQISGLNSDKDRLSRDKARLNEENEAKSRTISQQDRNLNKAWYIFGTKRELKDHNILKSGEVLTKSDFNSSYFTEIDIRDLRTIPLGSKSAKILTTHPKGSYTLEKNEDKTYTLHITNPSTFWSVSRYLVIQVK